MQEVQEVTTVIDIECVRTIHSLDTCLSKIVI